MRRQFFYVLTLIYASLIISAWFAPQILWSLVLLAPLTAIGLQNAFQKKKAILRNFPLIGNVRYLFESVRPEIQQYFIENETDGAPVPRELRSLVYQRAKLQTDTLPFGTQRDVYEEGYDWLTHSLAPVHLDPSTLRVTVGGPQCKKPYSASVFNISAMSYGALSKNAILALNSGAQIGGFYHNTGEGGVSPYHLSGGDVVWQIGTGYFGCRKSNGDFCPDLFAKTAQHQNIKMIEIKLSQGAKPAHGGLLPAAKITPEIMEIRKVEKGADVVSPPSHRAFSTPVELLQFVQKLRDLSGGKPVGFKLCVGMPAEFFAVCKAMIATGLQPDFITVDGGEGGTGAAPLEFSDHVGTPLEEGLAFVDDVLTGFGLREDIRVIASGKILSGFNIFSRMSLGADICNSARGMMMALGCIQARKCNTNHCPTGVATSNESLIVGLDPTDKKVRVANYHRNTVKAFSELVGAAGLKSSASLNRSLVRRRISKDLVKSYHELFPTVEPGSFIKGNVPTWYLSAWERSSADHFSRVSSPRKAA